MSEALRVAVVGVGSFGRNHVRVLQDLPDAMLVGIYDTSRERAEEAVKNTSVPIFENLEALAGQVDAAVVAVPTVFHEEVACFLLAHEVDVLVEKPIAPTVEAGERMVAVAEKHGRMLQVGHLERYNPAVLALQRELTLPLFFEIHRMSIFTPRSLDVDVVLDLMIHDLDIVLSCVGETPSEIRASGIQVLSDKVDIANVRLAFPGGCIANLTASRVSTDKVRKLRLFQPDQYYSLDYSRQEGVVFDTGQTEPRIRFRKLDVQNAEPLRLELEDFVRSSRTRTRPSVDGASACRALGVAQDILVKIREHGDLVAGRVSAYREQTVAAKLH